MGYTVYKHVNKINNKVYIGITGNEDPNDRWKNGLGYKPYGKNSVSHLYFAIKKYGWDSFESFILYEGLSYNQACKKEVEMVDKYNSTNRQYGYNKHVGGLAGMPLSDSAKQKIGEANKGQKNGMYGVFGERHPMYGKTHSEKTRAKLREKNKGRIPWNKGKKGIYTKETRLKISKAHKGNKYNLGRRHTDETKLKISKATSRQWTDDGFRKLVSDVNKGNKNRGKKVICGEKTFETITDCAKYLKIHRKTLSRWLKEDAIPKKHTHLNIRYENTEVN